MYCIHLIFSEAKGMQFYLNQNFLIKLKWQRRVSGDIFQTYLYFFWTIWT